MDFRFLFFLLLLIKNSHACQLKKESLILSGPVASLIEELGLLKDPKLKGVTSFAPLKSFSGVPKIEGGIFLAKKTLDLHIKSLIIFDKSRDLRSLFERNSIKNIIEVDTYSLDSFESTRLTVRILSPFITGCEEQLAKIEKKIKNINDELKSREKPKEMIFFLGEIKSKFPQLIIVADGFVKTLIKRNLITTYKSKLSYVPWSSKLMKNYQNYLKVGVTSDFTQKKKLKKIDKNKMNINFVGALTPGLSQLKFLDFLLKQKLI